jgi:hypothetical protein
MQVRIDWCFEVSKSNTTFQIKYDERRVRGVSAARRKKGDEFAAVA